MATPYIIMFTITCPAGVQPNGLSDISRLWLTGRCGGMRRKSVGQFSGFPTDATARGASTGDERKSFCAVAALKCKRYSFRVPRSRRLSSGALNPECVTVVEADMMMPIRVADERKQTAESSPFGFCVASYVDDVGGFTTSTRVLGRQAQAGPKHPHRGRPFHFFRPSLHAFRGMVWLLPTVSETHKWQPLEDCQATVLAVLFVGLQGATSTSARSNRDHWFSPLVRQWFRSAYFRTMKMDTMRPELGVMRHSQATWSGRPVPATTLKLSGVVIS